MHNNNTTTEVNSKYDQVTYKMTFAIYGLHQHNRTPATKFLKDFQTITLLGALMSLSVAVHEQTKTNSVVGALCVVISLSQQCRAALLFY